MGQEETTKELLSRLPGIDTLLETKTGEELVGAAGSKHLAGLARLVIEELRTDIRRALKSEEDVSRFDSAAILAESERRLDEAWRSEQRNRLRRVVNASGVIIHTNLGRAPLSEEASRAAIEHASRYCSLEYDVETGKRGRRGARAEQLLADITGAESALIVNNCAAACVLVLTALSNGGEAVISRGELVEIGGDFRVPDVMEQSGARLVEVGTTNKTKASDYEKAITENTMLVVRVHPSNYRIVGFTSKPGVADLAEVAHRNHVLLYEDAGSGALSDMTGFGMSEEPVIGESIKAGADVVTFSGDKLIGGIQAGLIVGRSEVIARLRKHPLYRALRVSKLVYAILESTFEAFRRGEEFETIPVLEMISKTPSELRERAFGFAHALKEKLGDESDLSFEIGEGRSVIGGGSAPDVQPGTTLITLKHKSLSASAIESRLRLSDPPVVCRVFDELVAIDLRTVHSTEEEALCEAIGRLITEV